MLLWVSVEPPDFSETDIDLFYDIYLSTDWCMIIPL